MNSIWRFTVGAIATLLLAVPASAQHMYLDSNGDGLHTPADLMRPNGTATVADVYLITNQNRDSSAAICNVDAESPLNINTYVINLLASGGTVSYDGFTNAIPSFTLVAQPLSSNSTEFTVGYFSGTPLPPGKYKLGTVTLTGEDGAAAISFTRMSSVGPYPTSFGTNCPGSNFDNTYTLEDDWGDADGLGTAVAGAALSFDGVDDRVTVPREAAFPAAVYTISAWIRTTSPTTQQIMSRGEDPETDALPWAFGVDPGGRLFLQIENGPSTGEVYYGKTIVSTGGVHHVAVTRDSSGTAVMYVDGAVDTIFASTVTPVAFSANPLQIGFSLQSGGGPPQAASNFFNGEMDDLTLWNVALTSTDILGMYYGGLPPSTAGLLGRWMLDEGTGQVAADASGADLDATLGSIREPEASDPSWIGPFRQPIIAAPAYVAGEVGSLVTFAVIALDPDGDPIESLTAEPLPAGASFETSPGNFGAIFTWTPNASQAGRTAVTITASNAFSGSAVVQIEVFEGQLERPPVVTAPVLVAGLEGSRVTFTVTATDPDEDHIESLEVAPLPPGASFEVGASNASGTFDWTPSLTQAGVYELVVTARSKCLTDSSGTVCDTGTAPVTLEISDAGQNPAPPIVTAPSNVQVEELGTLSVTVTASDPDDGSIVSLSADRSGLPEGNPGTFTTNPTLTQGELVWHPRAGEAGTYAVTFTAVDSGDMSASATTTITAIPTGVTVVGEVKWTPAAQDTGTFTITFTAVDADSEVTTATTDVTVTSGPSGRRMVATRAPSALMEPQRGPIISVNSSASIPTGENWTLTVSVTPDDTPPEGMAGSLWSEAMEPTRGPIISLRADLSSLPQTNPPTFTTSFDPQVSAPAAVEGQPGTAIVFQVSAGDPDGEAIDSLYANLSTSLPAGSVASFTANLDNTQGTFSWVPQNQDVRDAPYRVVFIATNALVDSDTTLITVRSGNHAPVADAGGPYSGLVSVPVAFNGNRSSDPDGNGLQYSWTFGDGSTGTGAAPSHAYNTAGDYLAVLTVTDIVAQGPLTSVDSASVHISASLSARASTSGGDRVIRLRAAKPTACVQLEPVGAAFEITDFDLSSIVLRSPGTGSVSEISAVPGKKEPKDLDGNGVLEISVCFEKDALRQLFSEVDGRVLIQAVIAGRLQSGAPFLAPVALDVVGASGALSASLAPNPFNPTAVLSFELPQAGRVRLHIFDLAGRLVREAIRGEHLGAGYHDVPIDGRDGNGRRMASGVYFYRLETPSGNATGRIVLMQ